MARSVKISALKATEKIRGKRSSKRIEKLCKSIRAEGFRKQDAIIVIAYQDSFYILDGHHRYKAALKLKLDEIFIEQKALPYSGFNTTSEVLQANAECYDKFR